MTMPIDLGQVDWLYVAIRSLWLPAGTLKFKGETVCSAREKRKVALIRDSVPQTEISRFIANSQVARHGVQGHTIHCPRSDRARAMVCRHSSCGRRELDALEERGYLDPDRRGVALRRVDSRLHLNGPDTGSAVKIEATGVGEFVCVPGPGTGSPGTPTPGLLIQALNVWLFQTIEERRVSSFVALPQAIHGSGNFSGALRAGRAPRR